MRRETIDREQEFAGRTALITGGSRGIGRAICERLATTGARIALNYVANTEAALETQGLVEAAGGRCNLYQADVADLDQTRSMFETVKNELGPVDLLITNAGIARSADGAGMTAETWREIMRVNLDGTFHTVWQAKDDMKELGFGRIVCMSSILGLTTNPINPERLIAYSTAKSAVIGFVRNCAAAFGPDIRVNGVAPGFIETDMTADVTPAARERLEAATALRRIGRPQDVAELVHFLLSDRSNFITGHTHVVSGGLASVF